MQTDHFLNNILKDLDEISELPEKKIYSALMRSVSAAIDRNNYLEQKNKEFLDLIEEIYKTDPTMPWGIWEKMQKTLKKENRIE
jgi:hypothetical protein